MGSPPTVEELAATISVSLGVASVDQSAGEKTAGGLERFVRALDDADGTKVCVCAIPFFFCACMFFKVRFKNDIQVSSKARPLDVRSVRVERVRWT